MFSKFWKSWTEEAAFRRSLRKMPHEQARKAEFDRWFNKLSEEKQAAYTKIWSIQSGDVLLVSWYADERQAVIVTTRTLPLTSLDNVWRLFVLKRAWGDDCTYSIGTNGTAVLRLARLVKKIIHTNHPDWPDYVRWVWSDLYGNRHFPRPDSFKD